MAHPLVERFADATRLTASDFSHVSSVLKTNKITEEHILNSEISEEMRLLPLGFISFFRFGFDPLEETGYRGCKQELSPRCTQILERNLIFRIGQLETIPPFLLRVEPINMPDACFNEVLEFLSFINEFHAKFQPPPPSRPPLLTGATSREARGPESQIPSAAQPPPPPPSTPSTQRLSTENPPPQKSEICQRCSKSYTTDLVFFLNCGCVICQPCLAARIMVHSREAISGKLQCLFYHPVPIEIDLIKQCVGQEVFESLQSRDRSISQVRPPTQPSFADVTAGRPSPAVGVGASTNRLTSVSQYQNPILGGSSSVSAYPQTWDRGTGIDGGSRDTRHTTPSVSDVSAHLQATHISTTAHMPTPGIPEHSGAPTLSNDFLRTSDYSVPTTRTDGYFPSNYSDFGATDTTQSVGSPATSRWPAPVGSDTQAVCHTCNIPYPKRDVRALSCGHWVCRSCLAAYIRIAAIEKRVDVADPTFRFNCPQITCPCSLHEADLRFAIGDEAFEQSRKTFQERLSRRTTYDRPSSAAVTTPTPSTSTSMGPTRWYDCDKCHNSSLDGYTLVCGHFLCTYCWSKYERIAYCPSRSCSMDRKKAVRGLPPHASPRAGKY